MRTKLSLFVLFIMLFSTKAATITVSNDPANPGDYVGLQGAHDAAMANDTIQIYGSIIQYGQMNISKPLVIQGAGHSLMDRKGSFITRLYLQEGSSGTIISGCGLLFIALDGIVSDLSISNNTILALQGSGTIANSVLYNNLIYLANLNYTNSIVSNNLIYQIGAPLASNLEIANNYILSATGTAGMLLRNNFIGSVTNAGAIFENNIMPTAYSVSVSGNNIFADDRGMVADFLNFSTAIDYIVGDYFDFIGLQNISAPYPDLDLLETSPGKNAGTDGTDIGIYGGAHPYVEGDTGTNEMYRYFPTPEEFAAGSQQDPIAVDQEFCTGARVSDLVANGADIKWYQNAMGGSPLESTKKLVSATYYVTETVGVESERLAVMITVDHCTTISSPMCGSTLDKLHSLITAKPVLGATMYRFRISDGVTTETLDKTLSSFRITETSFGHYDQAYTIDVAAMVNDEWSGYGSSCTIMTPVAVTRVTESLCGTNVSTTTLLRADILTGATAYRFRVTDGITVYTVDRPGNRMTLKMLPDFNYNTVYTIDVAVQVDGDFTDYGPVCHVTLPAASTSLQDAFCGTEVTAATLLRANPVTGATAYRFRISDGITESVLDRPGNSMRLSMLSDYDFDTTYTIDVAVEVDGAYTGYGTTCEVTVPSIGARYAMNTDENIMPEATDLVAYPNPFSNGFTLSILAGTTENVTVQVYDISGKQLEDLTVTASELRSLTIGERYSAGMYNVVVTQGSYQKSLKMVKK